MQQNQLLGHNCVFQDGLKISKVSRSWAESKVMLLPMQISRIDHVQRVREAVRHKSCLTRLNVWTEGYVLVKQSIAILWHFNRAHWTNIGRVAVSVVYICPDSCYLLLPNHASDKHIRHMYFYHNSRQSYCKVYVSAPSSASNVLYTAHSRFLTKNGMIQTCEH